MTLARTSMASPPAGAKTILVTGSTDGIGKATAAALARMGHRVIVHGRDREKGRAVKSEIGREATGPAPDLLLADLSSLARVRGLAEEVESRYERLDVLVNNAGVYMGERALTADGLEMTFAVNVAAPFLLSRLLVPVLERAAPARIVNVASGAHFDVEGMNWGDLTGEKRYDGWEAYARSKLGMVLLSFALAGRLDPGTITVNCLHPGVICTKLLRAAFPVYPCDPPETGARTSVYLATSPEVSGITGKYFDEMRVAGSSRASHDRRAQDRLWNLLEEVAGRSPEGKPI